MRLGKILAQSLVAVLLCIAFAEICGRTLFGLAPLVHTRTLRPVFVSGDYLPPSTGGPWEDAPDGPKSLGYQAHALLFGAESARQMPRTTTSLSDFLFDHYLSRYSAADVDRVLCDTPDALPLFVLGGSGAAGTSATNKLATWHTLLETNLRRRLGKSDIFVFNAAMSGFISYQEKLAFYLAVLPRQRGAVILYNSYNDLLMQADGLTRIGDPYWTGIWYANAYGNRLLMWLAENSGIVNRILQINDGRLMVERVERLRREETYFGRYVAAVVDTYMENMREVLSVCEAQRRACWVVLQPNRTLSGLQLGDPRDDVVSSAQVRRIYDLLKQHIEASPYSDRFIDLTAMFQSGSIDKLFTDPVHISDMAQPVVAEALASRLTSAIEALPGSPAVTPRCLVRQPLQVLAEIDLRNIAGNGQGRARPLPQSAGVEIHLDPAHWSDSAQLSIGLDPALQAQELVVRVKIQAVLADVSVLVRDSATGTPVSPEQPFTPRDGEVVVDLTIRGHPSQMKVVFKKYLADGSGGMAVVKRVELLGR